MRRMRPGLCGGVLLAFACSVARGEVISIPNYSFESPATEFVDTRLDSWQKFPKPDWFIETPEQQWDQLIGVFKNTAPGSADHIDNVDGNQAIYLFAVPQAGFFQDYDSISGTNSAASHEFDQKFEVGKSYKLTVGVVGGGGNMLEGASMLASLYYRDGTNMVTVASTPIVHSTNTFPTKTHLVDVVVVTPTVKASDAWAGKNVGIMFVSTAAPDKAGGYWDLDNVRLEAIQRTIIVPNYSFELPATEFVDTRVESWQKFPKPDWFVETPEQQWDQLIGVFKNTAPGSADHIDNIDGNQGIYLFAVPQAGFFQDYNSIGGTNGAPSHEFDAKFEVGKSYKLSVGVIGGGGNMVEGASMLASLYYRDAIGTNMVPLATIAITHSTNVFPNRTHFVDFDTVTASVQPGDAWAGKNIGIMFMSTAAPDKAGGYWDLDNVRLSVESISPTIEATVTNGELRLTWQSVVGKNYQIQSTADFQNWTQQGGTITGNGAEIALGLPLTGSGGVFFRLREIATQ